MRTSSQSARIDAAAPLGTRPADIADHGVLADGTVYYGKLGEVAYDPVEDRVQCHLCGQWLRWTGGSHIIRRHGWTIDAYRDAFRLAVRDSTMSAGARATHRAGTIGRAERGEVKLGPMASAWQFRPFGDLRPELAAEWHPTRNGDLTATTLGPGANERPWWRCSACGHEWQATVRDRFYGPHGCTACANRASARRATGPRARTLAEQRPDLAAQLHPIRNGDLTATALGPGSRCRVWWRCCTCGHEWQATPHNRRKSAGGCPACTAANHAARAAAGLSQPTRSLAELRPDLAAEWHPTRNGDLTLAALPASSHRQVWWLCPTCGREWQSSPNARGRARYPGCKSCACRAAAIATRAREHAQREAQHAGEAVAPPHGVGDK